MRFIVFTTVLVFLVCLLLCYPADSKPTYSVSCGKSGCHTSSRNGFTVTGHDTMTDLGNGNLKTFTVETGQTVTLGTTVTDGHNRYAVVLQDFEHPGIEDSSHALQFTTSSNWRGPAGENPPYYSSSSSSSGHSWSGTTTQRDFVMTVDESTPPDFYRLQFELAGDNGGRWAQTEDFYLHVIPGAPTPGDGDIDGDGDVDMDDVALLGSNWGLRTCNVDNGFCDGSDIDVDGEVGFTDMMELSARWLMKKPVAIPIVDEADDAEESLVDSGMDLTSSDLELVSDGQNNPQLVGVRFNNVNVPAGRDIADAFIQFTVDESDSGPCALTIHGQASDNPAAFTNVGGNISSRPTTTTLVHWSPPDWLTVGQADLDQQTPNLAAVIAEITDRPGWTPGNSVVFIFSGTGERTAEAYSPDHTSAPVLHIVFDALPEPAAAPDPPHTETAVSTSIMLTWLPGAGAAVHDVYFGATNPPPFQATRITSTFDPGQLSEQTTYYWRIDEVNFTGTTTGQVWSFTTAGGR